MSISPGKAFAVAVAALAGPAVAVALAAGGGPQLPPVTIGSTTGMPDRQATCTVGNSCTYVPYSGAEHARAAVPLDGTVTSFAVNSGSAGNVVELSVLAAGEWRSVHRRRDEPARDAHGRSAELRRLVAGQGWRGTCCRQRAQIELLFDTTAEHERHRLVLPAGARRRRDRRAVHRQMPDYRLLVSATILPNPTTTTISTTTTDHHNDATRPAGAQPRQSDA